MFDDTKTAKAGQILVGALLVALALPPSAASAASVHKATKEGNRLYEQGDYAAAQEKFQEALEKDPESDIVNFNLGTAKYKDGKYQEAVDHLQKVFLSDDDQLKLKAHYNTGNALYQLGRQEEQAGTAASAIPIVEDSLKQYERALEIDKADQDTKHNYEFVQKELKRLKELQQQQQQDKQNQQSQDKQKQQEQQKQQKQQKQQGQQDQQNQEQKSQGDQQQQSGQGQKKQQDQQEQQAQGGQEQKQKEDQQGQNQQNQQQGSGERQDQSAGAQNNQQNAGQQQQSASELTPQEAQMLLKRYQQTEEPQEPLNVQPQQGSPDQVLQDW